MRKGTLKMGLVDIVVLSPLMFFLLEGPLSHKGLLVAGLSAFVGGLVMAMVRHWCCRKLGVLKVSGRYVKEDDNKEVHVFPGLLIVFVLAVVLLASLGRVS